MELLVTNTIVFPVIMLAGCTDIKEHGFTSGSQQLEGFNGPREEIVSRPENAWMFLARTFGPVEIWQYHRNQIERPG